jgi:hypothetical protein
VLLLPTSAIKTSNGAAQVTIMDGTQLVAWDVQTGATDGSKTQIVAGLDEGTEVVVQRKGTTSTTRTATPQRPGGMGPVFGLFR